MSNEKCSDCKTVFRLSKEDKDQFEALARPLMRFLDEKTHLHCRAVIWIDHAEISEEIAAFSIEDYVGY